MTLAIATLFAGYAIASYGHVLLKGWDITPRQWIDPIHPWTWPAKGSDIPKVPATQFLPG